MNRKKIYLLVSISLIALNLRPAIASVSPVLNQIRLDLGLSHAVVSLLTMIPTLCLGAFAFVAPPLARRFGRERTVLWATVGIGVATVGRLWGTNIIVLFSTTLLVGIGIAIAQTLLPVLVKKHFPENAGMATGLYMTSLLGGTALATAFTAPAFTFFNSWPVALAIWSGVAIISVAAWLPVTHPPKIAPNKGISDELQGKIPWRQLEAWALVILLFGLSFVYFAELTWLDPYYIQLGWSAHKAGFLLTTSIAGQVVGGLLTMIVLDRFPDRRPAMSVAFVISGVGLAGAGIYPLASPWLWAILMGLGMGSLSDTIFTLPVDYAPNSHAMMGISAMVLGLGYFLGSFGPLILGLLRDLFGGYMLSFLGLAVFNLLWAAFSWWFHPKRVIKMQ